MAAAPATFDFQQIGRLPVPDDNCAIATRRLEAGTVIAYQGQHFTIDYTILEGHRFAVEPIAPEPAVATEEPRVVAMTPRSLGVPQRWNLWELERVAREQSGPDAIRDEERSFLLMYLREFADADGVLPTSFDGVVREAFGDVLDAVRA